MFELAVAFAVGAIFGATLVSSTSSESADSVRRLLELRREAVRSDYAEGRMSHEQFAGEVELLEDPATERVMYAVTDVDGVGPRTALAVARRFRSIEQLASADRRDLEAVNGVGSNRAGAIQERSFR